MTGDDDSIAGDPVAEGAMLTVHDAETENGPGTLGMLNLEVAA